MRILTIYIGVRNMSFLSKVELKKQLFQMGIKVEGNCVKKKDITALISNNEITAAMKSWNFVVMFLGKTGDKKEIPVEMRFKTGADTNKSDALDTLKAMLEGADFRILPQNAPRPERI